MNLAEIIAHHPEGATALVDGDERLTYGELRRRVQQGASALAARGIHPGDRVGISGDNSIAVVTGLLAVVAAGAVAVPLNPHDPIAAIDHELATVGASLLLVGPGATAPSTVPVQDIDALVAIGTGTGADYVCEPRDDSDLAVLLFTSGTAGAPRAAMLSHANLVANQRQAQSSEDPARADDVVLGVLPWFHVYGLNAVLGVSLLVGAAVVLVRRFAAAEVVELIGREHITVVAGVPSLWQQLLAEPTATRDALASVRSAFSGAAALSHETFDGARERWGITIAEGYGLTEAAPIVTTSTGREAVAGSIGRVVAGVEVRLVDSEGADALVGDEGEILVKGPNVFVGYWHDPDSTARVLSADGWLRTGDIAVVDDDGRLYIVDRVKDLVIVSGFNVFPSEVEDVLNAHSGVAESAVIGVSSPTTGETVKAYVVLAPGAAAAPNTDELTAHCRGRLARYKCPTQFAIVADLPKGTNGKILRRVLR